MYGFGSRQGGLRAVVAHRDQVLGDELALLIDRNGLPVDRQLHAFGNIATEDAHARTVDADVLHAQPVLAVDTVADIERLRLRCFQ